MATFEHDAVIVTLASRGSDQVKAGLKELHAGNLLAAEVFLNAAAATMQSLVVLLESPPPPKPPLRKLCIVGTPRETYSDIPEWMNRKANSGGPDDGAA